MGTSPETVRYYRAAGRSLAAVQAHQTKIREAIEDVRAFVMLCGAERALGHGRISGLHFLGPLPHGWIRNASAPLMAIPDLETSKGISLARKMDELFIPGLPEFAQLIDVPAAVTQGEILSPLLTLSWPRYEKIKGGWAIVCPEDNTGNHHPPPDAQPLSATDYQRLVISPSFNLLALDSEDLPSH